jgi:hypothetical protein
MSTKERTDGFLTKQRLCIRHKETGEYIEPVEIDQVVDGERDEFHNLLSDGGVQFRTGAGKTFLLKFTQFMFCFNRIIRRKDATATP